MTGERATDGLVKGVYPEDSGIRTEGSAPRDREWSAGMGNQSGAAGQGDLDAGCEFIRTLAAILMADVANYGRLMGDDEPATA